MKNAITHVYPAVEPQLCIFHINKNINLKFHQKWDKSAAARVQEALAQHASQHASQFAPKDASQPTTQSASRLVPPTVTEDKDNKVNKDIAHALTDRYTRPINDHGYVQGLNPIPSEIKYSKASIYQFWEHMVYSHSQEDFDKAWVGMKAFFPEQKDILKYLKDTYLAPDMVKQ
ncbi:hypothetical protein B0T25DRAFT_574745 [Lasiosphaeria hispida]|uniref:MULE transposase domain-containing protein n=1 Tax=Lasiosphaeria hispida TaxID=260671 RepID=A0AAJ0H596_9PEZI|nr:hypothetical protein B0T25DRAFT_574745 [Lasiosphaeria hispida]